MTVEERLSAILTEFRDTVKPLMAAVYKWNDSENPINILNEIRALNDHIGRCYREGISEVQVNVELDKAEGHLQRLVFECLKQLNLWLYYDIKDKESSSYSYLWLVEDAGQFWKQYVNFSQNALEAEIEAKKQETINPALASEKYQVAYNFYLDVEVLLDSHHDLLKRSRKFNKIVSFKKWTKLIIWSLVTAAITALLRLWIF